MENILASYERLKLAIEAAESGVIDLNTETGEMYISPEFKALFGYGDDEVTTRESLYALVNPDDLALAHFIDRRVRDDIPPPTYQIQLRILAKSGKWRWVEMQCIQQLSETGQCRRIIRCAKDITNQIHLEVASSTNLQAAKTLQRATSTPELYALFFELLTTTLNIDTLLLAEFETDTTEPTLLFFNSTREGDRDGTERIGRYTPFFKTIAEEKQPVYLFRTEQLEQNLAGQPSELWIAVPFRGKSGRAGILMAEYFHSDFIFAEVYIELLITTADQITLGRKNENTLRKLTFQASHDSLTGLINRQSLLQELNKILGATEPGEHPSALLMIDLNRFKPVNDCYGHIVGDELLRQVARRMQDLLDGVDHLICRWAGDEFVIVLRNVSEETTQLIAETICYHLQNPFTIDKRTVYTSASIGTMLIEEPFMDAFQLIRCADIAMYHAKAHSRPAGSVVAYSQVPEDKLKDLLWLETDLHQAIDNNEFRLKYQPMVDPQSGRIEGLEALARWIHPLHGEIPPNRFIPIAEETGIIADLGLFILQQACLDAVALVRRFPHLANHGFMSVNVSPRQLYLPNFADDVQQVIDITDCPCRLLNLELTESSLVENPAEAIQMIRRLKALGVSITIDDFGTGYSSLSYLVEMTVDGLKIDRQFVVDMDQDPRNAILLRTIINLANDLGLKVTAEGIETEEQFEALKAMGCHLLQGYLIAHPLALDDVIELMENRQAALAGA
jgi:diguanylate cyclase (GGDEF)-like protein/PAS domain S-box-containing protein